MDTRQVRKSLEAKLAQLISRLAVIEEQLRSPGSQDSGERAVEIENDEVLEKLDVAERAEIDGIRRAIARIDKDAYDTCSRCGGRIPVKRLKALPYTDVCVSCADRLG